jgi:rare lipoprotein A
VTSEALPPLPGVAVAPPRSPAVASAPSVTTQPLAPAPLAEATPAPSGTSAATGGQPRYVWGGTNMAPIVDGPGAKPASPPAAVEAVAAHRDDGSAVIVATDAALLFVQAGAFSQQGNADAMRNRLAAIGPTLVTPVEVGGKQLFRVRVGPVASPEEADHLLRQVVSTGQTDARIVVETGS